MSGGIGTRTRSLISGNTFSVQCALSVKGIVRSEPRIQQSLSTIPRDNLFKVLYFVDMDTVVHTSGRSMYQMCSWTCKLFKVRKYENSRVHSANANQQIANPQIFMINPHIANHNSALKQV
jgi:hypothetical protein